jgi:hypothetical protein
MLPKEGKLVLVHVIKADGGLRINLHLGTTWRRINCFMIRPPYPRGNCPQHRLNRRMGVPQNQVEMFIKEKICL